MKPEQLSRREAQQPAGPRVMLGLGLAIAISVIGFSLARAAVDPRFAARLDGAGGLAHTTRTDVESALDLRAGQNAWLIDRAAMRGRLQALPWVARAAISVNWPNKIEVSVSERAPVARVALGLGKQPLSGYALIDGTQRVLTIDSREAQDEGLPSIVIAPPPPPSAAVPSHPLRYSGVGKALRALQELHALGLDVSGVAIAASTGISVTADRNVRVIFGDDDDLARKTQIFKAIMAEVKLPQLVAYIDVRSVHAPTVLYR